MTSKACPLRYTHVLPEPTPSPHPATVSAAIFTGTTTDTQKLPSNALQDVPKLVQPTIAIVVETSISPPRVLSSFAHSHSPSLPRYDSPQAIYGRYCTARSAWYAARPRGSVKTNQEYRRAMGLPLRYDKKCYEWCLDYKWMKGRCSTSHAPRDWTKEEMMTYLDWNRAEHERVGELIIAEDGQNPFKNSKRYMSEV
ncbi:mule transposase domain protein [Colletotrichum truncatum]|uniref:Mule transposase domain protein n=1 Tax=Colletotrichum truncatum TaxID=5467 RepID=A0ACC3YCK9_COLTU